jgi:hypothetical protein
MKYSSMKDVRVKLGSGRIPRNSSDVVLMGCIYYVIQMIAFLLALSRETSPPFIFCTLQVTCLCPGITGVTLLTAVKERISKALHGIALQRVSRKALLHIIGCDGRPG